MIFTTSYSPDVCFCCFVWQTIENIDKHLDFAIVKYSDNEQVKYAVDKVQTEVCRTLH